MNQSPTISISGSGKIKRPQRRRQSPLTLDDALAKMPWENEQVVGVGIVHVVLAPDGDLGPGG